MVGAVDNRSPPIALMWVEFIVSNHLVPMGFFSGLSGFSPSTKTNPSKFQFDLDVDKGHKFISHSYNVVPCLNKVFLIFKHLGNKTRLSIKMWPYKTLT